MIQNLSFTLSLYSGQMCTTPQDIFIPANGIDTDQGHKSFDEVAEALSTGITKFLSDPERAGMVLGCIQAEVTDKRVDNARELGTVVRESDRPENPWFKEARMRSPLILAIDSDKEDVYMEELFGSDHFPD